MTAETTVQQVEVKRIKLSGLNPRKAFDPKGLTELAESIKVVEKAGGLIEARKVLAAVKVLEKV